MLGVMATTVPSCKISFLKKILFIHLRQREKQTFRGDPDAGLNPSAPGSRTEPKADAQPQSHPDVPILDHF